MTHPFVEPLSSRWTFFYKFVFPILWIGGFSSGTAAIWIQHWAGKVPAGTPPGLRWGMLAALLAGSAFITWTCARLKQVGMDAQFLYISNFTNEIQVPLSQVVDVTESRWDNSHPVTLHFSPSTPFGEKVTFMPKLRLFGFGFSHPVVARIREAANLHFTA